jgi:flagellar protein FliO/FliZ
MSTIRSSAAARTHACRRAGLSAVTGILLICAALLPAKAQESAAQATPGASAASPAASSPKESTPGGGLAATPPASANPTTAAAGSASGAPASVSSSAAGVPATGVPATGVPATGSPAAGAPAAGSAVPAGSLLQILLALVLVLVVMMGVAWALKRFGLARNTAGAPIRIVGGISVSARERILVIEVADQWIVVGVAPGRVNTLATMPRQDGGAGFALSSGAAALDQALPGTSQPYAAQPNFAAWLKQTIEKRNGK